MADGTLDRLTKARRDAAVRLEVIDLLSDEEENALLAIEQMANSGDFDPHRAFFLIGQLTKVRNIVHKVEAEARQSASQDYGSAKTG